MASLLMNQRQLPAYSTCTFKTWSNDVNNNILTFENYLVDQIPEAENLQPSSIPEITRIITNFKQVLNLLL